MPVLWFEQHVVADESLANLVKLLILAPTIGQILGMILVLTGLTLIICACFCKREKHVSQLINKQKTENQMTTILPESLPLVKK